MAPDKITPEADLNIDFNRVSLALAKRQSMLASLMGLNSLSNGPSSPVAKDASDDFAAEPELLGVGARKTDDDEDVANVLSAEARLKRQLLPKNYDKKQLANTKPKEKVTPSRNLLKEEEDSDDDAGRSSLGRRKRKREMPDQGDGHKTEDTTTDVKDDRNQVNDIARFVETAVPTEQKSDACSDTARAKKRSQKRRTKN